MAKAKEPVNPFYVLLVIAGAAFLVTACAYELMAVRAMRPQAGRNAGGNDAVPPGDAQGANEPREHALMAFLDRHGVELMTWELIALGITTTAAMGLDQYRWRRQAAREHDSAHDAETRARIR